MLHETEVSKSGEATELHNRYYRCKKNPHHGGFIPVQDFRMEHLPAGYHDGDLLALIKATADLTLRIEVHYTSASRPECWPDTYTPYAFYDKKESDITRVGTGRIFHVSTRNEGDTHGDCPCQKCSRAGKPSKVFGKLLVSTATHVVFDDGEARKTTCRLFYDRQDSAVIAIHGYKLLGANVKEDRCQLECMTCDTHLLDRLDRKYQQWFDLWLKVHTRYKTAGHQPHKLTVIASHPHGCPKRISVGQWVDRVRSGEEKTCEGNAAVEKLVKDTKYTYTACTCPGSSGAYVYILGCDDVWLYSDHVHSGVDFQGLNVSSIGWK